MFEIKLTTRRDASGRLTLALRPAFRLVFAALAVALASGMAIAPAADGPADAPAVGWLPVVILVVLVFGALYDERWIVDDSSGRLIAHHGILAVGRRRVWLIENVDRVEYEYYRAGTVPSGGSFTEEYDETAEATTRWGFLGGWPRKHYLRYGILMKDGRRIQVEVRVVRSWPEERRLPEALAGALHVPLTATDPGPRERS